MHKVPNTTLTLTTTIPNHLCDLALQALATNALQQWGRLKAVIPDQFSSQTPQFPPAELSTILFNRYPLTFSNYLRLQPLSLQQQFLHELSGLPAHFLDLNTFSTKLSQYPALSLAFQSYLNYRKAFKIVQRPQFFHLNVSSTEFLSTYNRPEVSELQFIRNSKELGDRVRLKSSPAQVQNYIEAFHTSTPSWAVLSHLPIDVTVQSIIAIMSKQGGYQECILLPPEPTTLTKIAFIGFTSITARDSACTVLNGALSPHPDELDHQQQQSQPQSQPNQQTKKLTNQPQGISASQYRLRLSPWVSSSQFASDSSTSQATAKSIHYRQPMAPVGLKQWAIGPIPLAILNKRLDNDVANALLMGQFFDYIRLIPIESNLDHLLEHLNRHLSTSSAVSSSSTPFPQSAATPAQLPQQSSVSPTSLNTTLKFKFILRYLRQVHYFDYFTTTLYPTKEALNIDIGHEWFFLDPPPLSVNNLKQYSSNFSTHQFFSTPLPQDSKQYKLSQQQKSANSISTHSGINSTGSNFQNNSKAAELALESSYYTPSLRGIPFDQSLSPEQIALTSFYNSIIAVSPPSRHQTGSSTQTQEIGTNFWNLQHFYQQLFYPSSAIIRLSTRGIIDAEDAESFLDTIFAGIPEQQPKYPSTDPNFWKNIDSAAAQIAQLFDPSQIDRTATPTLDMMDPDLFYLPQQLFSAPTLTTSLSQLLQHQQQPPQQQFLSAPIPPSVLRLPEAYSVLLLAAQLVPFYKQLSPDRFKCNVCPKMMVSKQTIIKHILTQHGTAPLSVINHRTHANAIVPTSQSKAIANQKNHEKDKDALGKATIASMRIRLLQNAIYLRYLHDDSAAALSPPIISPPQMAFLTKNFNPHINEKNQFKIYSASYRVNEILVYKRHMLAAAAIDRAWDTAFQHLLSRIGVENNSTFNDKKTATTTAAKSNNSEEIYSLRLGLSSIVKRWGLLNFSRGLMGMLMVWVDSYPKLITLAGWVRTTTIPMISNDNLVTQFMNRSKPSSIMTSPWQLVEMTTQNYKPS